MNKFNENDLIAYHLQDLSPSQARAIRRALKINPELAAESEAILATLRLLDKTEETPMVDAAVLKRNWSALYPSLHVIQPQSMLLRWRRGLSIGTALALLTMAALYMTRATQRDLTTQTERKPSPHAASVSNEILALTTPSVTAVADAHSKHRTSLTPFISSAVPPFPAEKIHDLLPQLEASQLSEVPTSPPAGNVNPLSAPGQTPQPSSLEPLSSPADKRKQHKTDLSIGVYGDFTLTGSTGSNTGSGATANAVGRSQSVLPSAGALVSFHQQFRPTLGYRVSTGYTQTTFNYTYGASNTNSGFFYRGGIGTRIVELTGAYVIEGPHTKRVSSFADVGGGMLTFIPTTSTENTSYVFRPAAVAGAGVDLRLTPHLALRSEFRAVSFRGPDFRYHNGSIPVTTRYTFSSEPTIGLTYQFGKLPK